MPQPDEVQALLEETVASILSRRRLPEATYRLQFHAGFTFRDACSLVPYLHELGITDCYASPYLKAHPGSKHGYDISDHSVLNPEIGSPEGFEAWVQALRARGMGQILDIVPNHMGIAGNENAWWNDVLENGPSSPCAHYFDIDWYPAKTDLHEKVLLPILGEPYGKVLESQQLSLRYGDGAFAVHYFDHRLPIAPETAQAILRPGLEELSTELNSGLTPPAQAPELLELQSILTALSHLPPRSETAAERRAERHREKEVIKRRLAALVDSQPCVRAFIDRNLALFNGWPGGA
jgi:(1->4)-alpha-D-glucan 1-alpha-D-glucosylmutase